MFPLTFIKLHDSLIVVSWCASYHYYTTSFSKTWTYALHRFQSCSWHFGGLWRSEALKGATARNKALCLSLVNHFANIIHFHHQQEELPFFEEFYYQTNMDTSSLVKAWDVSSSTYFLSAIIIWNSNFVAQSLVI